MRVIFFYSSKFFSIPSLEESFLSPFNLHSFRLLPFLLMYHSYPGVTSSSLVLIFDMTHMNDDLVTLSSDYRNGGSSSSHRGESSANSDFSLPNTSHFAPRVINVSNIFELVIFSRGSRDRETFFNESSFDALISDEYVRSDCAASYVSASFATIGDFAFSTLTSSEAEVVALNSGEAQIFI